MQHGGMQLLRLIWSTKLINSSSVSVHGSSTLVSQFAQCSILIDTLHLVIFKLWLSLSTLSLASLCYFISMLGLLHLALTFSLPLFVDYDFGLHFDWPLVPSLSPLNTTLFLPLVDPLLLLMHEGPFEAAYPSCLHVTHRQRHFD